LESLALNGSTDPNDWIWADKFVDDRQKLPVCAVCGKSIQTENLDRGVTVHKTHESNGTLSGKSIIHFVDLCHDCTCQATDTFENWTGRVLRANPYWIFKGLELVRLHTAKRLYYAQELVEKVKARGDYSLLKGSSK